MWEEGKIVGISVNVILANNLNNYKQDTTDNYSDSRRFIEATRNPSALDGWVGNNIAWPGVVMTLCSVCGCLARDKRSGL